MIDFNYERFSNDCDMSEWIQQAGWNNRLRIQAWSCSLTLHLIAIGLAMVFTTHLTLTREEEPFRWNVAMVESVSTQESVEPSPPLEAAKPTAPEAAKPVLRQTHTPAPVNRRIATMTQPVRPPVETTPQETIVEPVERPVQTGAPTQPIERVAENRPSTVETTPMMAAEPTITPAIIEPPGPVAESTPAPIEPIERAAETAHVQPTEHAPQDTEPPHQPVARVEETPSTIAQSEPSPPVEQPAQPVQRHPVETAPDISRHEAASAVSRFPESATTDRQATQEDRTVIAKAPPTTTPSTRADYGWVRDALRRRIVEMKQYPAQARLNHWEGKVVLRAVIRADGHLGELTVKESSGHRVLDEAAMDVIRRICPVPLKQDLGKPEIVVMIPIDYRLE